MALTLMKGSEAIAEAAIRAGCRYFFGYPITPQTEIPEYMSARMPEIGGCFLQAESEVGAINMVYGAAGTGARVLTSSSSPGVSLKQEGISYIAASEHIHLFHGLSFTEAAKHLGMTRQNLTGIYNAAIYKIQKKHFRALCSC